MAESILSGVHRSLANMIPLVMRKNELDWRRAKYEEQEKAEQAKLLQEAEKVKTDYAKQLYMESIKSGNANLAQSAAPAVEKGTGLSLPKEQLTGPVQPGKADLTRYLVPEKEKKDRPFNIEESIWNAVGGDLNKYISVKQRMKEKGGKGQEINTLEELATVQLQGGDMQGLAKTLSIIKDLKKSTQQEKTGTTPGERSRVKLEDDIQQDRGRLASIESRQNIMTEALDSEQKVVVKRLKKSLKTKLEKYEREHGKDATLKRFGVLASDYEAEDPLGIRK